MVVSFRLRIFGGICCLLLSLVLMLSNVLRKLYLDALIPKEQGYVRSEEKKLKTLSVLQKVRPSDIRIYPYPHVVIENALPDELYNTLSATFPKDYSFGSKRQVLLNNKRMNIPAKAFLSQDNKKSVGLKLWKAFMSYHISEMFALEVTRLFTQGLEGFRPDFIADVKSRKASLDNFTVATRHTTLEKKADLILDAQFGINTPVHRRSVVRGPHTDNPNEIWAGLLYFKNKGDISKETSGALEIWDCQNFCKRIRNEELERKRGLGLSLIPNHDQFDKRELRKVLSVPYKSNTLVGIELRISTITNFLKFRFSLLTAHFQFTLYLQETSPNIVESS